MTDLDAIMSERRQLTNLAYRLLGSLAEAEDAVQETYARWYAMTPEQRAAVEVPAAWLTTVASRICAVKCCQSSLWIGQKVSSKPTPARSSAS